MLLDRNLVDKKIKSASQKLLFISNLGNSDAVDFRNKLLGEYKTSLVRLLFKC
jgi:hypothetical protein